MNVQNFSFNLFSLTNAHNIWKDSASFSLTKLSKTAAAAVCDIYVKNPYDVIIGNVKALIGAAESQSRITKLGVGTVVAFGSLYTLMLYGLTFHLQGRCLLALGSKLGIATLEKVGSVVKKLGTDLFVTGAVPIYGFFYAFPKQIFLSLPKMACLIAEKITFMANSIFQNLLQPLWAKAIIPSAQVIARALNFFATKVGAVLKIIESGIVTLANTVFKYVLKPVWENALLPVLQGIKSSVVYIASTIASAFKTVEIKIAHTVRWLFKQFISPFWKNILLPIAKGIIQGIVFVAKSLGRLISAAAEIITQIARWVFQELIAPMWNKIILPILHTIGHAASFAYEKLAQSIQALTDATVKVASFIFKKLIAPIFTGITNVLRTIGKFLGDYVVTPLITVLAAMAEKVGKAFKTLLEVLIAPTLKNAYSVISHLRDGVHDFGIEIWQTITSVWNQVTARF